MLATPEDNHWLNDQIKDNVVFYGNYDLGHQSFLIAKDMSYFDDVIKVIKEQLNLQVEEKQLGSIGSGIEKDVLVVGTGEYPEKGEEVTVHYTGKLTDGTVFDSSVKRGDKFKFKIGAGQVIPCWDKGVMRMRIGEKAVLHCPAEQAYGSRGAGGVIPPNSDLKFEVELFQSGSKKESSKPKKEKKKQDTKLSIKEKNEKKVKEEKKEKKEEKEEKSNKRTLTDDSDGIKKDILKEGTGEKPAKTEKVLVHYTGKLTDGTVFDSSVTRGDKFSFIIGIAQVIKCWDKGMMSMKVGEKAILHCPADQAYGASGAAGGKIPPNADLIFEVELFQSGKKKPKTKDIEVEAKEETKKTEEKKSLVEVKDGITKELLTEGTGDNPEKGEEVTVHYTGTLTDGTVFDSSVKRGDKFKFKIGVGQVIQCWDKGVMSMKIGEKAILHCPAGQAYGATGAGGVIPPNADLLFEVELFQSGTKKPKKEDLKKEEEKPEQAEEKKNEKDSKMVDISDGITKEILVVGTGASPKKSDKVVVHYTGKLTDGKVFDSSVDRGDKFSFTIGVGQVIKCWDKGVMSMKVGEKSILHCPADQSYGASGAGRIIPPNADLIFEVELFSV